MLGTNVTLDRSGRLHADLGDIVKDAGAASEGMYISVAGQPNEKLGPAGKKFVKDFGATQSGGQVEPVLGLRGPGEQRAADGDREARTARAPTVADELFNTNVDGRHPRHLQDQRERRHQRRTRSRSTADQGRQGRTFKMITPPPSLVKVA